MLLVKDLDTRDKFNNTSNIYLHDLLTYLDVSFTVVAASRTPASRTPAFTPGTVRALDREDGLWRTAELLEYIETSGVCHAQFRWTLKP